MSTRSRIGYMTEDGKYESIYCHNGGSEFYNGAVLLKNYLNIVRVKELISYGDASYIEPRLDQCCFYHRDRDEDWDSVKPKLLDLNEVYKVTEEYNYVFINGEWFGFTYDIGDKYSIREFLERN